MTIRRVAELTKAYKAAVFNIWNSAYPAHLAFAQLNDLEDYLAGLSENQHYLVMDKDEVKGWLACFDRDGERWFLMLLDKSAQGKGLGTQLLDNTKQDEMKLNGWVIDHNNDVKTNGQPYPSPLAFYEKQGFEVLTNIRLDKDELRSVKIRWARL